jgi:membrane-associated phospholipid phosphatase
MFVRFIADGTLLLILLIALPIILLRIRHNFWEKAPLLLMAALTSLLVGKLMSLVYQPAVARPFIELGMAPGAAYIDNPGFPSDHALLATVVVVALYMITRNRQLTAVLGVLVIIMCVGRVAALVHSPLDVVAGVVAGLSGAVWYRKLTK